MGRAIEAKANALNSRAENCALTKKRSTRYVASTSHFSANLVGHRTHRPRARGKRGGGEKLSSALSHLSGAPVTPSGKAVNTDRLQRVPACPFLSLLVPAVTEQKPPEVP